VEQLARDLLKKQHYLAILVAEAESYDRGLLIIRFRWHGMQFQYERENLQHKEPSIMLRGICNFSCAFLFGLYLFMAVQSSIMRESKDCIMHCIVDDDGALELNLCLLAALPA